MVRNLARTKLKKGFRIRCKIRNPFFKFRKIPFFFQCSNDDDESSSRLVEDVNEQSNISVQAAVSDISSSGSSVAHKKVKIFK